MGKVKVSYGGKEVSINPLRKHTKKYEVKNPTLDRAKKILTVLATR